MLKTLAEIALEAELASSDVLERCAAIADREDLPLVETLVRDGKVDEVALLAALRKGVRVPVVDPGDVDIEPQALRSLSADLCRRRRVMPLSIVYEQGEKRLRLAMADPTDPVAIAEVEERSGLTIVPELMTLSAIVEMVDKEYKKIVTEVVKRDRRLFGSEADTVKSSRSSAMSEKTPDDNPKTIPFHRISDEAEISVRFTALLRLLIENKIISEDEFEDEVRDLLKELAG